MNARMPPIPYIHYNSNASIVSSKWYAMQFLKHKKSKSTTKPIAMQKNYLPFPFLQFKLFQVGILLVLLPS